MELRDATFSDLKYLLPLAHEAHLRSVFKNKAMNEAIMQRNFVVAMNFDDGFAKVVERGGKVVGGLVGVISDNHYGIRCAQDLFCYSRYGTPALLRNFVSWAEVRAVEFIQITDLGDNQRYQKLLRSLGFRPAGANFAKVM